MWKGFNVIPLSYPGYALFCHGQDLLSQLYACLDKEAPDPLDQAAIAVRTVVFSGLDLLYRQVPRQKEVLGETGLRTLLEYGRHVPMSPRVSYQHLLAAFVGAIR